jgi:hypothetical protein
MLPEVRRRLWLIVGLWDGIAGTRGVGGAAEKFDKLFEADVSENSDAYVSKMLATAGENETERCGTRTHDTLIKSEVLFH